MKHRKMSINTYLLCTKRYLRYLRFSKIDIQKLKASFEPCVYEFFLSK
jgi:hypothetical protein